MQLTALQFKGTLVRAQYQKSPQLMRGPLGSADETPPMARTPFKRNLMTLVQLKKASIFVLCTLVVAQSPHCPKGEYLEYEFQLQGCPSEAFSLPDTAAWDKYQLTASKRRTYPACSGFKLYELVEDRKGLANPDVGSDVYVRVKRGQACRLHVIMHYAPPRDPEPDAWAEVVAKLVTYDSGAQAQVPAVERKSLGLRETFQRWCSKREPRADIVPKASLAERRCG